MGRTIQSRRGPPTGKDLRSQIRGTVRLGRFEAAREIDDGYALAYPRTWKWRRRIQDLVSAAPQRMPLFRVEIQEDSDDAYLWVHLTGPAEAKEYLDSFVAYGRSGKFEAGHREWLSIRGRARSTGERLLRRLTSPVRVLPNFCIIGAAKCGTTSLYGDLVTHPSICSAARKETYFFDHAHAKGLAHYRAFFPTVLEKRRIERVCATPFRTGEATPCYLFHPHAPRRIAKHLPNARLIALLRNPVDRAYSEHYMKTRRWLEHKSFESAIEREPERVEAELEKMLRDENYFSYNRWHFSYLGRGRYAEQLEHWFKFIPREQILVLASEDFFKSPAETYGKLMRHLGLPEWTPERHQKTNFLPYPEMNKEARARLVEYFTPYNQQLYDLLGRTFDWDR